MYDMLQTLLQVVEDEICKMHKDELLLPLGVILRGAPFPLVSCSCQVARKQGTGTKLICNPPGITGRALAGNVWLWHSLHHSTCHNARTCKRGGVHSSV